MYSIWGGHPEKHLLVRVTLSRRVRGPTVGTDIRGESPVLAVQLCLGVFKRVEHLMDVAFHVGLTVGRAIGALAHVA